MHQACTGYSVSDASRPSLILNHVCRPRWATMSIGGALQRMGQKAPLLQPGDEGPLAPCALRLAPCPLRTLLKKRTMLSTWTTRRKGTPSTWCGPTSGGARSGARRCWSGPVRDQLAQRSREVAAEHRGESLRVAIQPVPPSPRALPADGPPETALERSAP